MDLPIVGTCDDRFVAVAEAFRTNFAERGEVGASVHVVVDGEVVVDLAGGWADECRTRPFGLDTVTGVYSVGKAVIATLVLQLVDAGDLTLDTRIAEAWPEFGVGGKDGATIRQALCHQAAVPAIAERLDDGALGDWQQMAAALAATPAWWVPGERHAYHVNTYGHLLGEIVRRATGEMPSTRLRRITDELGLDVSFGVAPDALDRCADTIWAGSATAPTIDPDALDGDDRMRLLAHHNPPGYSSIGLVNTPEWRAAEVPSTNGHASARGIAGVYAALLEPGRLLSPDLLAVAAAPQSTGPCPMLGEEVTFGLGFTPTSSRRPLGPNPRSFGHFGSGGALGFADPDAGVAFGYAMNHLIPRWQSTRNRALIDAVFDALASVPSRS